MVDETDLVIVINKATNSNSDDVPAQGRVLFESID